MTHAIVILALMVRFVAPGASPHSVTDGKRETFEEGARRYLVIADAIDRATRLPEPAQPDPPALPELARYALAVVLNESALRLDVHRGDNHDGRRTKMEDNGHSWCLGQIHLGPTSDYGRSLVGVGPTATRRCIAEVVARLKIALRRCGVRRPACVFAAYGGVKHPKGHAGIVARVKTYAATRRPVALTERTKKAIE